MNANRRFELEAAAFHRMTGILAPGKDQSAVHWTTEKERQFRWNNWRYQYGEAIDALLWAIEKEEGDNE